MSKLLNLRDFLNAAYLAVNKLLGDTLIHMRLDIHVTTDEFDALREENPDSVAHVKGEPYLYLGSGNAEVNVFMETPDEVDAEREDASSDSDAEGTEA